MSAIIRMPTLLFLLGLFLAGCGGNNSPIQTVDVTNQGTLDPALVGNWGRSTSYTSGDFGFATQEFFQILDDGTWRILDSRIVGGGPAGGIDSGQDSGIHARGHWQTRNAIIHINEGFGWVPFAGYYLEDNKLLLKFHDGSRQVWYRH